MAFDVFGALDGDGGLATGVVADHVGRSVPVVPERLDEADGLLGDGGAAHATQQFLGLAGEHGARDYFNGAAHGMGRMPFVCRHSVPILRCRRARPKAVGEVVGKWAGAEVDPIHFGPLETLCHRACGPLNCCYSHPIFQFFNQSTVDTLSYKTVSVN